jgi:hypothetical protein
MERWRPRRLRRQPQGREPLPEGAATIADNTVINYNGLLAKAGYKESAISLTEEREVYMGVAHKPECRMVAVVVLNPPKKEDKKVEDRYVTTIPAGHYAPESDSFEAYKEVMAPDDMDKISATLRARMLHLSPYRYDDPRIQQIHAHQREVLYHSGVLLSAISGFNNSSSEKIDPFNFRPLIIDELSSVSVGIVPHYLTTEKPPFYTDSQILPVELIPDYDTLVLTVYGGFFQLNGEPFRVRPIHIPLAVSSAKGYVPTSEELLSQEDVNLLNPLVEELLAAEKDKTFRRFTAEYVAFRK